MKKAGSLGGKAPQVKQRGSGGGGLQAPPWVRLDAGTGSIPNQKPGAFPPANLSAG